MEKKKSEAFNYTYSAKEQEEIRNIRKKYAAPEEDKMTQLRRLDTSLSQKATTASLIIGIIGALLLGLGMSLAMSELAHILGSYRNMAFLIGILMGIVGIVSICLAYPLYNRVLGKERERMASEIIRLTDELMK